MISPRNKMLKFQTLDWSEPLWWYHCKYSDLNFTHMGILIWVHMTHHAQRCKCMQYGTASYLRTIVVHISEPFDIYSDSTCTLPIHSSLRGLLLMNPNVCANTSIPFCQTLYAAKEMLPLFTFSCGMYPFLLPYTSFQWSNF